jgi:hypothetical protein
MRRLILPALCAALATQAHALTDTNTNGLSDDWEKAFNGGQLFSAANPNHAPTADPDADGWTNLQEATAGTDPFHSLPPSGIVMPSIAITPATYEPLPVGIVPPPSTEPTDPFAPAPPVPPSPLRILLDPAEIRLTWQPIPGKTYRALLSPDLLAWSPASGTYVGGNDPITYETVPLHEDGTMPEKLFWRVETGDTDTDGDTISDYEEILRNLKPLSADTDGDGLPDNTDPAPLVNTLQAIWDADLVDPSAAPLFAAFSFTPHTLGGYPFTAERVTDFSGNNRHGKARTKLQTTPPVHNAPQANAEGIANHGFRFANAHHFAFDLVNPGINFAPVTSLSFWLKTKAADLEGNGQPVFSYVPKLGVFAQNPNSSNPYAARAFVRKQASGTGYEVVWLDWTFPGNIVRERWPLDLTAPQLDERWINLTFVWQGGSGASQNSYWACYANGVKQIRTLGSTYRFQTAPNTPNTPQDTFLIGADAAGGSGQNNLATVQSTFKGTMDRVRIHTAALTPVQILAIVQQDTDNDGLWDTTEAAATAWKDTNGNGRCDIGEIFYPNGSPLIWQHSGTDSDSDGITDILEQNSTRTDPYNHDSERDLLPDGWEVENNLNPNSSTGIDGQTGDPDNDGVDNFREWQHLTNPRLSDSDGDTINDATEISQGSNPNSGGDNGHDPLPEETLTLKILVGDPSSSHSERWRVEATEVESGEIVLRHASRQYGQVTTAAESTFNRFKPGKAYSFQLIHAGTDPAKLATDPERLAFPDYDWTLQISYKNADGSFTDVTAPAQTKFLLLAPYNADTKSLSGDGPNLLAPEDPWGTIGNGSPATLTYRYDMLPTRVVMLPLGITPDANRDGKIDLSDRDKITPVKPWRFWANDDNDSGDTGGDDIPQTPGSSATNGYDHRVNGVRDLIDFFPLDLNLQAALKIFPQEKYRYKLTHEAQQTAPCFKIVQARTQNPATAGHYLKDLDTAAATDKLECLPIHSTGRNLDSRFLDAQAQGNGLLLVEAIRPTTKPIKLAIIRKSDQKPMGEVSFPVSISSVESMFRHVDLTQVPLDYDGSSPGAAPSPLGTKTSDPSAFYPDTLTNGKYFVFLHGFNVPVQRARGWNAEVFKRLHQMGSKARFVGVTWTGATGIPAAGTPPNIGNADSSTDYHKGVFYAMQTGDALASALNFTQGADVTIAAHSLGNMVVGEAIQNGGFTPNRYYIINGAVPTEAYLPDLATDEERWAMTEAQWKPYGTLNQQRLYASSWHTLFPAEDNRRKLTWKNRFAKVSLLKHVHNFYSLGDDVVQNPRSDTALGGIFAEGVSRGAWGNQEMMKGTELASYLQSRYQGGWGFNFNPQQFPQYQGYVKETFGGFRRYNPEETPANVPGGITDEQLKTKPFFSPFKESDLFSPTLGSAKAGELKVQRDILAAGVPARSYAIAANAVPGLAGNYNMEGLKTSPNSWPVENHDETASAGRWLHSDFKNVALAYLHKMYTKMIEIGGLNQP